MALITLANLRGIRESGTIFAIPAYFFVASLMLLIVTGAVRLALGHDLAPGPPENAIEPGTQAVTLFLVLRAFSSGSAALTGIEAVSNGVPAFKPPEAKNAATTLFWMAGLLTFFFLGLTVLAFNLDIAPSESRTVVAQIAEGVFGGENVLFYMVQAATAIILLLAANTSFADFPRLSSVMARDEFMPRQFMFRGDRLAFSSGIMVLGLASIGLLIAFQAETHALIPLYAVGVFVGFTLSQAGLVLHWYRDDAPGTRRSLAINAVGAVATGTVAVVIGATKFLDGAWVTMGSIALIVAGCAWIGRHYRQVDEQLDIAIQHDALARTQAGLRQPTGGPAVMVPVEALNRAVLHTLAYARSISTNVTAVHITDEVAAGERLRDTWDASVPDIPLVIVESPYRSFLGPMLAYIDAVDHVNPGNSITVVVPAYVPAHFWEGWLHNQSSARLKRALLRRPNTAIVDVRYHLHG